MSGTSPIRVLPPLVIVADDEPVTRRLVSAKLEREGFRVVATSNGEELVACAKAEHPAGIILDIMMPIRDGFSTLQALTDDPTLADIPIIMLSGKSNEEDVLRCLQSGAMDYVVKPFSPDELVTRLRKYISRSAAARLSGHAP